MDRGDDDDDDDDEANKNIARVQRADERQAQENYFYNNNIP